MRQNHSFDAKFKYNYVEDEIAKKYSGILENGISTNLQQFA